MSKCPCCEKEVDMQVQSTRKGDLHMATCHNPECPLCGYTLTTEGYSALQWERYIKDAGALKRVKENVGVA